MENSKQIYVNDALKSVFDLLNTTYGVNIISAEWLEKETFFSRKLEEEFDPYESYKISYSYAPRALILFADKYYLIAFGTTAIGGKVSAADASKYETHILALPLGIKSSDINAKVLTTPALQIAVLQEHILKVRENYFKKPIGYQIFSCLPTENIVFLQKKYGGKYLASAENNFENVLLPLLRGIAEENLKKL